MSVLRWHRQKVGPQILHKHWITNCWMCKRGNEHILLPLTTLSLSLSEWWLHDFIFQILGSSTKNVKWINNYHLNRLAGWLIRWWIIFWMYTQKKVRLKFTQTMLKPTTYENGKRESEPSSDLVSQRFCFELNDNRRTLTKTQTYGADYLLPEKQKNP